MLGRRDVEPDDIRGLRFEIRIRGPHVAGEAMRLQPGPPPDGRDNHMRHAEDLRQLARTPVRRTVRRLLRGPRQHACFQARRHHPGRSAPIPRLEAEQAGLSVPGFPTGDVLGATSHAFGDVVIAVAVVQQKQHSGAARFGSAPRLRPGHGRELGTFSGGEESTHVSQTPLLHFRSGCYSRYYGK